MAYPGNDPPSVACTSAATTVGQTAVPLPATNLANRRTITIHNNGTDYVYIGASGVVTGTGLPIPPGGMRGYDFGAQVQLYAISPTNGQDVRTFEQA